MTTTVGILERHRRRTSGLVDVLGFDPQTGGRAYRERVGVVLQEAGFDEDFTVAEPVRHTRLLILAGTGGRCTTVNVCEVHGDWVRCTGAGVRVWVGVLSGRPAGVSGWLVGGAEVDTGPDGAGGEAGSFPPQLAERTSATVAAKVKTIRLQVLVMADLQ